MMSARVSLLVFLIAAVAAQQKTDIPEGNDLEESVRTAEKKLQEKYNAMKQEMEDTANSINATLQEKKEEGTDALKPCTAEQCNNRGTCMGTTSTFLCVCNFGFSGKNCEDTICDSTRDCNGRGLCLGTTNSLTCLCGLGWRGAHCEEKA